MQCVYDERFVDCRLPAADCLLSSGLSKKVQDIVERIRKRVNDAIDGVLKGLEGTARKLFKSKTGKKADSDTSPETNTANLPAHQLQDSVVGETVHSDESVPPVWQSNLIQFC
jgi:hypothetical protein